MRRSTVSKSRTIDRSKFDNSYYNPGPFWKRTLWYYVNAIFFLSPWFPFYGVKSFWLRRFGARVGSGMKMKPRVNVKYPWFLIIGDDVSIGEGVWIDNLAQVTLHDKVTLSQGALLLTGNHDYSSESFDLMTGDITISEGAWIGAKAIVGPGVTVGRNTVLALGSMTTMDLDSDGIYAGSPATFKKSRVIQAAIS